MGLFLFTTINEIYLQPEGGDAYTKNWIEIMQEIGRVTCEITLKQEGEVTHRL
jgi:hypothetical protein